MSSTPGPVGAQAAENGMVDTAVAAGGFTAPVCRSGCWRGDGCGREDDEGGCSNSVIHVIDAVLMPRM